MFLGFKMKKTDDVKFVRLECKIDKTYKCNNIANICSVVDKRKVICLIDFFVLFSAKKLKFERMTISFEVLFYFSNQFERI